MIRELAKRLYPSEIKSIHMLGVREKVNWKIADDGLRIELPEKFPGDHAYVFKIQRQPPWDME